ncbi:YvrJ family protein [Clostridium polynesiense]|uniref:YvrJ family protein n=1 Tax=Clostridium polynesiense TaxID=1325933 RepID=UPI0009E5673C|nr:YvrJ family protein [Clostridium polynesiense]
MDHIVNLIGNVGFPIAVSLYLLVRVEQKLEVLTLTISNLAQIMNLLHEEKKQR